MTAPVNNVNRESAPTRMLETAQSTKETIPESTKQKMGFGANGKMFYNTYNPTCQTKTLKRLRNLLWMA